MHYISFYNIICIDLIDMNNINIYYIHHSFSLLPSLLINIMLLSDLEFSTELMELFYTLT